MAAVDATVSLRMLPEESITSFAARVAQAHGPLTQTEVAQLRPIFAPRTLAPVRHVSTQRRAAPPDTTAVAPAPTRTAA